ncbi:MAG: C25 family cysteine peptidase [Phycisphaerales bacterium]
MICTSVFAACALLAVASSVTQPVPAAPDARNALLIIAPASFESALKPFIDHKKTSLPTTFTALDSILGSNPGADDPEKLKHALFDAWKSRSVRYVLLVGDADVMPVRYMVLDRVTAPAFDYAFYPCDLYYADVARDDGTFDDWNAQKEGFHAGYFGEVQGEKNKSDPVNFDAVSYKPELALGRWPVGTADEARALAAKTIAYEKGLAAGDKPGAARAALLMIGGWVDARPRMDAIAAMLPPRWTTDRLYYHDGKDPAPTPPPDEQHIVDLLNSGLGLVLHAGHGADDRWEGSLSSASIAKLKNADRLPIILSAGCSTARFATLPPYEGYADAAGKEHKGTNSGEVFTKPPPPPSCYAKGKHNLTGLGEQLLRAGPNGAVAYIGCNTGSQPCGVTLLEGFADATRRRERIGDCWADAVAYYYDHEHLGAIKPTEDWYPASIFFQGMKFMLFGDPSAPMPAAKP